MQRRVLVRARGLAAFRRALIDLALDGPPLTARRRAIVVPTRASGEILRHSIETAAFGAGRRGILLPDLLTRADWLGRLHAPVADAGAWATRIEREVILANAARHTAESGRAPAPFELRPSLVSAMLDFYDELERRQRDVRRFARTLFDELRVERGTDRGSERLIQQTCFLGFAFLAYERGLARSERLDEHAVRRHLLARQPSLPFDHLVIAVGDHPADPRGLWPADFDLIGRLRHIARVDVIVTDEAHDAGFRDRIERELPGIEDARAPDAPRGGTLMVPPEPRGDGVVFVSRDREEELRDVASRIVSQGSSSDLDRVAIVVQRPLPYLYLAQQVLGDARIPYQTFDAFPLAAEPYAAFLDLVLAVARTGGTRASTIALLRSTLAEFHVDGRPVDPRDVAALDAVLVARRATGDAASYLNDVQAAASGRGADVARARRAATAAADVAAALRPFREAARASEQIGAVAAFLRRSERPIRPVDISGVDDRPDRARAAVLAALDALADAFRLHDDSHRDGEQLTAAVHHAIEGQTFTTRRGSHGVHLVDATAARFGDFDHVHLVGFVEAEWPERVRRSLFYAPALLEALGWPQHRDQGRAHAAGFRDLLALAADRTWLSAFQLEGESVVGVSPMAELARDVPSERARPAERGPLFTDDMLVSGVAPSTLRPDQAAWLALRAARPPLAARDYSGFIAAQPPRHYRVSSVDRYVDCPFKYFAAAVLQLPEPLDEVAGLTPLERGTLLHRIFKRFYAMWQAEGRHAITLATLDEALGRFAAITREELAFLPDAERMLEETRLLGSLVARGVAERVFELEVDSDAAVRERWLECDLNGPFTFPALGGFQQRTIQIRGKADRIDVLEDGRLRVIDYKLGRMPDLERSIQIAVYAHCARQLLEAGDGAPHPVASAMYLAFGDDRRIDGQICRASDDVGIAVEARAAAFAKTVEAIEGGAFPPRPRDVAQCAWCAYAGVCRKEYVAQDDDAAEPV